MILSNWTIGKRYRRKIVHHTFEIKNIVDSTVTMCGPYCEQLRGSLLMDVLLNYYLLKSSLIRQMHKIKHEGRVRFNIQKE